MRCLNDASEAPQLSKNRREQAEKQALAAKGLALQDCIGYKAWVSHNTRALNEELGECKVVLARLKGTKKIARWKKQS